MIDPMKTEGAKALQLWSNSDKCKQAISDGVLTPDIDRHLYSAFLDGWNHAIAAVQKAIADESGPNDKLTHEAGDQRL